MSTMTLPPQNLEAERAVIGSVLLDTEMLHDVLAILRPEHFYRDSHGKIFQAIQDLYGEGRPVDGISVEEELKRRGDLTAVGGVDALLEIQTAEPISCNALHWARIVYEKAIARDAIEFGNQILRDGYASSFTSDELVAKIQTGAFQLAAGEARGLQSISSLVASALERYEAREQGQAAGLMTGIDELDAMTFGLLGGQFIILGARPSMGKTAFALALASYTALNPQNPRAVYFASMEMGADSLVDRMLVSLAGLDAQRFKGASLDAEEYGLIKRAAFQLAGARITIDSEGGKTAETIAAAARRANSQHRLGLIVVDYLQLMEGTGESDANRQEQIAKISRKLKKLAVDLDVPVVALSQLNRDVEKRQDKRPFLSDLRESGSLEQDADLVLLMFRPAYYNANDPSPQVELDIAKQRNGPTGRVELAFIKENGRFLSYLDYLDQREAF